MTEWLYHSEIQNAEVSAKWEHDRALSSKFPAAKTAADLDQIKSTGSVLKGSAGGCIQTEVLSHLWILGCEQTCLCPVQVQAP